MRNEQSAEFAGCMVNGGLRRIYQRFTVRAGDKDFGGADPPSVLMIR
jgi:hypothetical protein